MGSLRRFLNPLVLNLQKMELELSCPVCLKLLSASTMLPCYHTSCSECASTRTMNGYSCAICKSAYHYQDVRPASHLEAIVNIHRSLSSTVSSMVTQQEAQVDIPVAKTTFQGTPESGSRNRADKSDQMKSYNLVASRLVYNQSTGPAYGNVEAAKARDPAFENKANDVTVEPTILVQKGPCGSQSSDGPRDLDCDSNDLEGELCPAASPLLRRRMREAAAEGDLSAALDALGRLRPAPASPDYNALLHAYLRSDCAAPGHVAALISHMRRLGPAPNALTFNTTFNGLLRLGHLDVAHAVLEEMWSGCGFMPSFTVVDRLVKKAVSGANFDLALKLKVLDLMLRLDYLPTLPVANAIASVLVKSDGAEVAYDVFLVLLNRGFWPDVYMYNQILFGLCKSGRNSKALALFCNLRKRGLSLNAYSYTALVLGFCKGKQWGEAYRALVMMCHEGCEPSVVTYTVVVNFLCKDMKTDDAIRVFRMAYEEGCHLDITICNVLLHALCCAGRVLEAHVIIDVMEEAGFVPDCFTISALAAGFLKTGHVKTCQNFVQRVFTKGNVVDVVIWNIYLHSLCCSGQVRKAYALVNSMEKKGYLLSTVTYNTILKGFCRDMDLQKALQMLDRFSSAGVCYDSVSLNTILSAACRQGNTSVIQRVHYHMNVESQL